MTDIDNTDAKNDAPEANGKLKRKKYERELARLHVEFVKLQLSVVEKGLKVCILFEGRDGAGKGGTIKAMTERVSPRVFRVMALPAPTEREKSQMYAQRYIPHLPAAGEIVIFDRSWYNRAGVERVMAFCAEHEVKRFLEMVPAFERVVVEDGIILLKYWLEVSPEEQTRRLEVSTRGARSGSCPKWTSNHIRAGTITRAPATRCFKPVTPHGRRGTLCLPTINGGRGSTS